MKNNFSFRKAIALAALLLGGMTSNLSATTTLKVGSAADSVAGTYPFKTIKYAYASIVTPVADAYVIELQSGYDPTAETYPITFGAKTGASATNNITVKPATGVKVTIGPADKTVTATVTGLTFTSATTSVDLGSIITSGNISYLSGNVAASDITITTTAASTTATINSGTLTNGTTYYVSGNASIPARRTFTYNGSATVTLSSGTSVTAGSSVACKATPTTNSFVSGIGTYTTLDFYNVSNLSGNTITVPAGTFTATSINGNKLFVGPILTKAINFNGANYVTIDGVSRTDASTGITIQNPNLIYANTVYFTSGANNAVTNCIIKGANQTGSHNNGYCGQIFFGGGSNNTVTQNDICDLEGYPLPICLVTFNGGPANNTVSYNNMYNVGTEFSPNGNAGFFQYPSTLTGSNNNVLYNKMYWTKAVKFNTAPSLIGVGSTMSGIGHRIENNVIGYANPDGTGTASLSAISTQTALTLSVMSVRNCTVKNNIIGGISGSFKAFNGILLTGHGATSTATGDNYCYGNQVKDISVSSTATSATLIGIQTNIANAFSVNIKNNIVSNLSLTSSVAANTCTTTGIDQTGTASAFAYNYSGNQVYNLVAGLSGTTASNTANVCYGMKVGANANLVEKNLVYNIYVPNSSGVIRGIQLEGSNSTGTTFQNNIIRLGVDALATYSAISGLYQSTATSAAHSINYYHNSVYIGGTSNSGAGISSIFNRFSAKTPSYTFKNNIFSNKRSGNSIVNQIYIISHLRNIAASDKNLYEYSGQFAQKSTPSATFTTLADWNTMRTDSTLSTDGSINQTTPNFVAPTATTPDLRIIGNTSTVNAVGADLSAIVSDDFYGSSRGVLTPYDLGAYAYTPDVTAPTVEITAPSVASTTAWPMIPINITFSEDVTGFTSGDITVANATLSDFTVVDASHYTAILNTTRDGVNDVVVTADIAASVATDLATNSNAAAAQFIRTFSVATGAASLKASASVYTANNLVVIGASVGQKAAIYSTTGQLVKSISLTSDKVSVPMAKGFYTVVVDGRQTKVLVK